MRLASKHHVGIVTSSPYGSVGEPLRVQERLWISDCGRYYAQDACTFHGEWGYDVMTVDGGQRWLFSRYVPTGCNDTDPRYVYPEFPHMVEHWGNQGKYLRSGRFIRAFELGFGAYDTSVAIRPFIGNTKRASYRAVFHHRIAGHRMPGWAERLRIVVSGIVVLPFEDVLEGIAEWKEIHWAFRDHYGDATMSKNPLVWQLFYHRLSLKDHAEGTCPHDLNSNEDAVSPGSVSLPANRK